MNESNSSDINPFEPPQTTASPPLQEKNNVPTTLLAATRTNQLIHGALIQGVVTIAVILWFVRDKAAIHNDASLFVVVGGSVWIATIIGSFIVPMVMNKLTKISKSQELAEAISTVDSREPLPLEIRAMLGEFATKSLVAAAMLEGGAVINLVLWVVGGSMLHLWFVIASILLMASRFPTLNKVRTYVVQRLEQA